MAKHNCDYPCECVVCMENQNYKYDSGFWTGIISTLLVIAVIFLFLIARTETRALSTFDKICQQFNENSTYVRSSDGKLHCKPIIQPPYISDSFVILDHPDSSN